MLIPKVKEEHRATENNEGDCHCCHNNRTSNAASSATTLDGGCQCKYVTNIHSIPYMKMLTAILQYTEMVMYGALPMSLVVWKVYERFQLKQGERKGVSLQLQP